MITPPPIDALVLGDDKEFSASWKRWINNLYRTLYAIQSSSSSGADGVAGPTGAVGSAGLPGAAGADGAAGAVGAAGPPGADGDPGEDALFGPPGPQGAVGPQGLMGPMGFDGDPGDDGVPGLPGAAGADGAAGAVGAAGPPGADGDPGEDALFGPPGPQGAVGPQGATGPASPYPFVGSTFATVSAKKLRKSGKVMLNLPNNFPQSRVGKPVIVHQGPGPYPGKGGRDAAECEQLQCVGEIINSQQMEVRWMSNTPVRGTFRFNYIIGA